MSAGVAPLVGALAVVGLQSRSRTRAVSAGATRPAGPGASCRHAAAVAFAAAVPLTRCAQPSRLAVGGATQRGSLGVAKASASAGGGAVAAASAAEDKDKAGTGCVAVPIPCVLSRALWRSRSAFSAHWASSPADSSFSGWGSYFAATLFFWYFFNAVFAIFNKKTLNVFPYPWLLSWIQARPPHWSQPEPLLPDARPWHPDRLRRGLHVHRLGASRVPGAEGAPACPPRTWGAG